MRFDMYSPTLTGGLVGLIQMRDGNGGNHARVATHTWTGVPMGLEVQFNDNFRMDIGQTGIITARNLFDGRVAHIHYTAMEFTPPGVFPPTGANLEVDPATLPAGWGDHTVWEITIGETTDYMGIPYFKARLNELARTLARAFNEGGHLLTHYSDPNFSIVGLNGGHIHGVDLNETLGQWLLGYNAPGMVWDPDWTGVSASGTPFLNYFNINANNFAVNPALLNNPALLALVTDYTELPSGHDIIEGWLALGENRSLFREGRLGDFLSSITGDLGIVAGQAGSFARSYAEVVVTTDNMRRSVSGVNLDEESVSMIQHQLVFQAAARLLNVIDEIYDTTINRLGNW